MKTYIVTASVSLPDNPLIFVNPLTNLKALLNIEQDISMFKMAYFYTKQYFLNKTINSVQILSSLVHSQISELKQYKSFYN